MRIYVTFFIFVLTTNLIHAQFMNEEASLHYYWKSKLRDSRLYTDNGLGKLIWLKNQPANTITAYTFEPTVLESDGLFGSIFIDPGYTPTFRIESGVSQWGEKDILLKGQLNFQRVQTELSVNGFHVNHPIDCNQDGFTDLDAKKRLLVSGSWNASVPNYSSFNRVQFMGLHQKGGQINSFLDTTAQQTYATGLNFQQLMLQSQHLIASRKKDFLLIDLKFKDHLQKRFWGDRNYLGKEWMIDAQAQYEYHFQNELDIFRFGLQFRQQTVNEQIDSLDRIRAGRLGGGFLGYDTYVGKHLQLITNINLLYHNLEGLIWSPNLKVNYSPTKQITLNSFAGHGWRFANPLTEYSQYLYSNRVLNIQQSPLSAEQAWYYGAGFSVKKWIDAGNRPYLSFIIAANSNFTHRIYQQQVVADLDANAYQLRFYNLKAGDRAYKLSWEIDAQLSWTKPSVILNVDYRYDFAKTTINNIFREMPLYSRHNWLINLEYSCIIHLANRRIDLFRVSPSWQIQGAQRIPDVSIKTNSFKLNSRRFIRWDLAIDLPIYSWIPRQNKWKYFVIRVGFDNLSNTTQQQQFVAAEDPLGINFDGALRWNTPIKRRFYTSIKYVFE